MPNDMIVTNSDLLEITVGDYSGASGVYVDNVDRIISLTGEVGKTYSGIDPIYVNNDENKISADTWTFSAGSGVSLVDDNVNKVTTISVTAQGGNVEVENLVKSNSGTWDSVTGKQDTLTFAYTSGDEISSINNSALYSAPFTGLFQAKYGVTPYSAVKDAVDNQKIVYCSSGARYAFMCYSGADNYEFQYYRSVGTHSTAQQGDQVFVYKVTTANNWTVTTREAYSKISAGAGLSSTYGSNTLTIGLASTGGQVETAYLPLSSLGDSVGSGNLNAGQRCYVFGTDNEVRGINDFVVGSANTANADRNTVLFGECNSGNKNVLVLGSGNVGLANSLVLGESCSSHGNSMSLGESAYSNWYSVAVGSSVYASDYSLAVGRDTTAGYMSMAIGNQNSADYYSLAVGTQNIAEGYSMIAGDSNSGYMSVIAGGTNADLSSCVVVGNSNGSCKCSLVIGDFNSGCNSGICVGGSNSGDMYSVTVGQDNKVGWKSMAIGNGLRLDRWENGIAVGKYNKTSAACFVVGNGDADDDRSDLFVIDNQGIVSASDVAIPGGVTLATLYNAFTAYTASHP